MSPKKNRKSVEKKTKSKIWRWESSRPQGENPDDGFPRPTEVRLKDLVSIFLRDCAEVKQQSDDEVAGLYLDLVGLKIPCSKPGFVQFIEDQGRGEPTEAQLNETMFAAYQEFVARHHGLDALGQTMRSIENFWMWCRRNGWVEEKQTRPPLKRSFDVKQCCRVNWQCASIVRTIMSKTPDQLDFGFMLWTRDAVAELIKDRFKVRISKWTVGRLLKQWGMSPQKPVKRAYQQQPEVVKQWLDKEYPRIARRAQKENAEIQWGDEMGRPIGLWCGHQ